MKVNEFHLFFEQSGTFKKELAKLGYKAYDYDILNDFGETDYVIDLFSQINEAYEGNESIFDKIAENRGGIIAFFPCVRFSVQILLPMRGNSPQQKKWDDLKKIEYSMKLERERSEMYERFSKLCIVCLRKDIPLIIENPYNAQHYLTLYFPISAQVVIEDRTLLGDWYKKPTQFFFIGCDAYFIIYLDEGYYKPKKKMKVSEQGKVDRSMISPHFARTFLRRYVLERKEEYYGEQAEMDGRAERRDADVEAELHADPRELP